MIITPKEALSLADVAMGYQIENFNELIRSHIKSNPTERKINLRFDQWGYDWHDVQFIQDAGYHMYRNSACLWWEVTW